MNEFLANLAVWWQVQSASHPELVAQPVLLAAALGMLAILLAVLARRGLGRAMGALRDAEEMAHTQQLDLERVSLERDALREQTASAESLLGAARITAAQFESIAGQRQQAIDQLRADQAAKAEAIRAAQTRAIADGSEIARLSAELAAEKRQGEDKLALLQAVRKDMEDRFKALADAAVRQNGEALAKTSRERLEAALNPLKEHVGRFELELRAVHEGALKERQQLKTEIEQLTRRSEEVSREAVALTRALKGDKQRQGAWGEMILSTLLERSGLQEGVEYEVQAHRVSDDGGRYRPDVVVRMPGDKRLVIDSKVSLVDYETAVNAEGETDRAAARARHVAALRRHITLLSDKGYQALEQGSVDYVVMFIPIEGALSEALREAGDLTSFALEKNITIATPTTLMMALRTVSHVWAIERRNRNAEQIAARAGLLYDKVANFVDSLQAVGKNLGLAQKSYGEAMDRLSRGAGNVLGQVEKLKALGAKVSKVITADFEGESAPDGPDALSAPDDLPPLSQSQ